MHVAGENSGQGEDRRYTLIDPSLLGTPNAERLASRTCNQLRDAVVSIRIKISGERFPAPCWMTPRLQAVLKANEGPTSQADPKK